MKRLSSRIFVAASLLVLSFCLQAVAAGPEWPQWRGPGRDDISPETGLLKQWPEAGPAQVWSIKGLGEGYSGISVKDGRIYTMGTSEGGEAVMAFDFATGKHIWTTQSSPGTFKEDHGNGPRCTPTTDGPHLYTEDAFGVVMCLNAADGKKVWQVSLTNDLGGKIPHWGYTESPLILGKALIVTPGGPKGAIAALDKLTGKTIWQSTEVTTGASYASPVFATFGESRQIINCLAKRMVAVDADSGKFLWDFTDPIPDICADTPVVFNDMVFASANYKKGSGVVRVNGTTAEKLWYDASFGNHHGGVLRIGDNLYGMFDAGRASDLRCVEMKSGKTIWQDRSVGKGSLTFADGMLYCVSENNKVALVEATAEGYKEHGRFSIPSSGKPSWSHPVVVGGRLFIRNQDTLTCWDVKAK